MVRALVLLCAGLAVGCGGDHEVHLTIRVDDSVPADRVAAIAGVEITVLGAEPAALRYVTPVELRDRETTWIYKSKTDGQLQFQVVARAAGRILVAAGKSKVLRPGGSAVSDTIHLGAEPPNPDVRRLGAPCAVGIDTCASGFCVDGVCCESACDGPCLTCDGALPGRCLPAAAGTSPRKACPSDAADPCGPDGSCDGQGQCRIAPRGKICAQPSCTNGSVTTASTCDGAGTCVAPAPRDCTPYACNQMGNGCATICTATAGCAPTASCTTGSCGKVGLGARCFSPTECAAGMCVDGYCCDAPCAGACQSCKEPGHEGSCTLTVAGADDPHKVCKDGGAASCGQNGKCDGMGGCTLYPAGTVCAKPACSTDRATYSAPAQCAGDGTPCPAPDVAACAPYTCSTDGTPGCEQSCGECTWYDPGKGPPFADRCAPGLSCADACLAPDARFICQ